MVTRRSCRTSTIFGTRSMHVHESVMIRVSVSVKKQASLGRRSLVHAIPCNCINARGTYEKSQAEFAEKIQVLPREPHATTQPDPCNCAYDDRSMEFHEIPRSRVISVNIDQVTLRRALTRLLDLSRGSQARRKATYLKRKKAKNQTFGKIYERVMRYTQETIASFVW